MSLSRPTAFRFVTRCACIAGAVVLLLGILASPAMAWGGWKQPPSNSTGSSTGSSSGSSTGSSSSSSADGCEAAPTSTPFARFGDTASYSSAPEGSFEESTAGWSLSNAAVSSGNESYNVAGGSHSLAIQPNGEAVSPAFCVSTSRPTMRFFARRTSGSWGVLNVVLRWTDASHTTHDTTVAALQTGTSWSPTPILALGTTLPLWQAGETLSVRIVLKPEPYGGAWSVDDVFIDPPRMR